MMTLTFNLNLASANCQENKIKFESGCIFVVASFFLMSASQVISINPGSTPVPHSVGHGHVYKD